MFDVYVATKLREGFASFEELGPSMQRFHFNTLMRNRDNKGQIIVSMVKMGRDGGKTCKWVILKRSSGHEWGEKNGVIRGIILYNTKRRGGKK